MEEKTYRDKSWFDPRVEVGPSILGGKGLFARMAIRKNETVIIWGGIVMHVNEIAQGNFKKGTAVEIGEGLFLAGGIHDNFNVEDYMNHSCDPNLWLKDEVTLTARRDIDADEELTADYGMWVSRPEWQMECKCRSSLCRHEITGNDWKIGVLQKRYEGHFSPYLNERINKTTEGSIE